MYLLMDDWNRWLLDSQLANVTSYVWLKSRSLRKPAWNGVFHNANRHAEYMQRGFLCLSCECMPTPHKDLLLKWFRYVPLVHPPPLPTRHWHWMTFHPSFPWVFENVLQKAIIILRDVPQNKIRRSKTFK